LSRDWRACRSCVSSAVISGGRRDMLSAVVHQGRDVVGEEEGRARGDDVLVAMARSDKPKVTRVLKEKIGEKCDTRGRPRLS
jgi:hypothetical protein